MKTFLLTLVASLGLVSMYAQDASLRGQLQDAEGQPVLYANVALYDAVDSSLVKVETSDETGVFQFTNLTAGTYDLVASYLGLPDYRRSGVAIETADIKDLEVLTFDAAGIDLAEATVTATRAMVEVKPDRTVFNVQGTINAVGNNGLDLLRKAPGVTIDNNDNINVLSRAGVLIYVDGKRLPLSGADLANYLRSLTAEQIDRIDIITNPGAKYEAEGNAGIIDIRLKKDKSQGANATANASYTQGRYARMNGSLSGNYRNADFNVFGTVGGFKGDNFNEIFFDGFNQGLLMDEFMRSQNSWENVNVRLGTDFFLSDKHTIGFLVSGQRQNGMQNNINEVDLYTLDNSTETPDSLLRAATVADDQRNQMTYNLNYRFDPGEGRSLNIDLDYGRFRNTSLRDQPNRYFSPDGETLLSEVNNFFDTPIDIDIYTFKLDYEQPLMGGNFGTGVKVSQVSTGNTFLFYDVIGDENILSDTRSNLFDYDERVYAAYMSFAGQINDKLSYSLGLRTEVTDATGDLQAFRIDLMEPPVELNYVSLFPNAGITWMVSQGNTLSLNYGRRINRPDYNVLNPFRNQISQLSYERGNPFLNPEIVDNIELGYTIAYRYNIKLAWSQTANQITRLLGPDEIDPRAGFVSWDNLATQTTYSLNISAPIQITKGWNAYFNVSAALLNNQADYGDGAVIDLQAFTYTIFQQHTFNLPWALTGEVSGYFAGPGVWGGVFRYNESGSLNLGLQRKFLNDQLNVKISANDLFFTSGWNGYSEFNGLRTEGNGYWDSRHGSISLSYLFGNQNVKRARRRNTGLESEAGRVGG